MRGYGYQSIGPKNEFMEPIGGRSLVEASVEARIEKDMDPYQSASQMDTDEIILPSELRGYLECLVEAAYQAQGTRRIKNPRIWSLHDLEVLTSP